MDLTTLVTSAVSGAAGGFIKEISSNGFTWLIELVTAQSPEMQTAAKANMENFVTRLAQRVERLEREIPADKSEIFKNSLNHPGSALLIKTAIVDSATTDSNEKHELLAELIAHRLTADAEDMIALTGSAACSIVGSLSSRQIKILAILTTLTRIRPLNSTNILPPHIAKELIKKWWRDNLNPLLTDTNFKITDLDYEHLAAMGCIRISIASTNLPDLLSKGIIKSEPMLNDSDFISENWYETLKSQWNNGLGHATPTSVGQLIGILHRDSKLKTNTQINW